MIKEFRDFIAKGNVMDLAVGIIIGAAFTAIVTSLVNDLINPIIGLIIGGIDFTIEVNALTEIKAWILGWGRHAKVLGPKEFVEEMADELVETAKLYGSLLSGRRKKS